jgi:V/A-type H+-transporting ATPase subunit D
MERINPTRMNLIQVKGRTRTATRGYTILKRKREALVLEFLKLLKESGKDRDYLYKILQQAYKNVAISSAYVGNFELESASNYIRELEPIQMSIKNIMGVKIPSASKPSKGGTMDLGILSTSIAVDDISNSFREVVGTVLDVAQREQGLKRLVIEVEKTKRRVNALDYIVIPGLKAQAKYIALHLEELDRDTFSALKHVKKKISSKEQH